MMDDGGSINLSPIRDTIHGNDITLASAACIREIMKKAAEIRPSAPEFTHHLRNEYHIVPAI